MVLFGLFMQGRQATQRPLGLRQKAHRRRQEKKQSERETNKHTSRARERERGPPRNDAPGVNFSFMERMY